MVPQKGEKERLVELAENATPALVLSQDKEKIKREELRTIGAMNEVGALARLRPEYAGSRLTIFPIPAVWSRLVP